MPFNGSGVFELPATSVTPAVSATTISSSDFNTFTADLAAALSLCLTEDGQNVPTANLPMATFRHTGVGDATALTDYASANQVIDGTLTYGGASAAGTDTYAVNLAINPGAYVAGNRWTFIADVANTGACTLNISGNGAKSIKMQDGNDPPDNYIVANAIVDVEYDGTNMVLMGVPSVGVNTASAQTLTNKTYTNPTFTGTLTLGAALITEPELELLDGVTAGTRTVSKALSVDGSGTLDALDITDLTIGGVTVNHSGQTFGGLVYIATSGAITGSPQTVDFDNVIDATYDIYIIELINVVPNTDAENFSVFVQTGGVTWQTGAVYTTSASVNSNDFFSDSVSNVTEEAGVSGYIWIFNPSDTAVRTMLKWDVMFPLSTTSLVVNNRNGVVYEALTAVTGVRIDVTTTNTIASGEIRLYGVIN